MMKKQLTNLILLLSSIFLMIGCLRKGDETIALPEIGTASNVIPVEIRQEFESKMHIYEGTNPPDITGSFVISPMDLHYASDAENAPVSFADCYIAFYNRQGNTYEFKEKQSSTTGSSPLVTVIGSGNDFTAYFTNNSQSDDGSWAIQATLISGTITSRGIENIKYAFIMLDAYDPNDHIMEVNEYRIFYDGDGVASYKNWDYSKSSDEEPDSASHVMYSYSSVL